MLNLKKMLKTFQALLPKYRCGGNTPSGTHWPQCFGKGDKVPFRADNRTVNGAINGVNLNYTAKGISIAISITNYKMRRAIPFPRQSITALPSQIQYPRKNVWPFAGYSKTPDQTILALLQHAILLLTRISDGCLER
jgi:hypothetical protein